MVENENNKHPTIIINNAKNEMFREKMKEITPLIDKIRKQKSKNFQKAVKKFKNDENYEFNKTLIERHFLFKAVQEVNEQLTKNKEGFLVDFSSKLHEFFNQQLLLYWRMEEFITEDEILGINLVDEDFYSLGQVIKQNTDDKEFIPSVKKLQTDLPVIYLNAY